MIGNQLHLPTGAFQGVERPHKGAAMVQARHTQGSDSVSMRMDTTCRSLDPFVREREPSKVVQWLLVEGHEVINRDREYKEKYRFRQAGEGAVVWRKGNKILRFKTSINLGMQM